MRSSIAHALSQFNAGYDAAKKAEDTALEDEKSIDYFNRYIAGDC